MPKATVGIRVSPNCLSLVRLKSGWKGASVDLVSTIDIDAESTTALESALLELRPYIHDTLVTSLGADALFQRLVELPFSDKARAERTAPLEAEESLPLPLERLVTHVQILEKHRGHSKVFLIAAPLDRVEGCIEAFRAESLPVEIVDAEPLALATVASTSLASTEGTILIDLDDEKSQAVLIGPHGPERFFSLSSPAASALILQEAMRLIEAFRKEDFKFSAIYLSGSASLQADLGAWSEALGVPVQLLPFPAKQLGNIPKEAPPWPSWAIPLGLALREALPRQGASRVNLLRSHAAAGESNVSWRNKVPSLGVYLGVLLVLWGVGVGIETSYKQKRLDALKTSIRKVFSETFPDVKNVVDEVEQMRQSVGELEERDKSLSTLMGVEVSPLNVLRELSERIPPDITVEFREFVAEADRIRIDGVTTSFDSIDKIQARMQQYPGFSSVAVSDAKAGVEADKVIFKMTIQLGAPGGERK
jgi:Tfp pilus assembly PilM family ATPase/Tfp pilus assembly protein PilN